MTHSEIAHAVADSLMAYKYVRKDSRFKPFITHPTSSFALDDHVEWWQGDKYYCIAKDSRGNNKK